MTKIGYDEEVKEGDEVEAGVVVEDVEGRDIPVDPVWVGDMKAHLRMVARRAMVDQAAEGTGTVLEVAGGMSRDRR